MKSVLILGYKEGVFTFVFLFHCFISHNWYLKYRLGSNCYLLNQKHDHCDIVVLSGEGHPYMMKP